MINDRIKNIVFEEIKKILIDKDTEFTLSSLLESLHLSNNNIIELYKSLESIFNIKFQKCDIEKKFKNDSWIMEITELIEKLTRKEIGDWERERYIFKVKQN